MTDPKHSPLWQGLRPSGKTLPNGDPEPGDKPLIVNCKQQNPENCHEPARSQSDTPGLCAACTADFRLVLSDVPLLLDDLDIAIAGETRFVEHGTRNGTQPNSSGNQAIAAYEQLAAALMKTAHWFPYARHRDQSRYLARQLTHNLHVLANQPAIRDVAMFVSHAASKAHKVIDAPADPFYYGDCPECALPLLQERIHPDHPIPVRCRTGDYSATLEEHTRNQLALSDDRQLTLDELVPALTNPHGEPYSREQIKGWIYREGLPREKRSRPRYIDGVLYPNEVWTYRLGDVKDQAARVEAKRHKVAS